MLTLATRQHAFATVPMTCPWPVSGGWYHCARGAGLLKPVLGKRARSDRKKYAFIYIIFSSGTPEIPDHDPSLPYTAQVHVMTRGVLVVLTVGPIETRTQGKG